MLEEPIKRIKADLEDLTRHEERLEVAWKAYETLHVNPSHGEEYKSLKLAAKHALQAFTELLRVEIQMIGKISPKIANDIESDLNKWQKKASKEIEEGVMDETSDVYASISEIRNKVRLVRKVIQDTVDTFEESVRGYEPTL
jgi:gas vesicle protein